LKLKEALDRLKVTAASVIAAEEALRMVTEQHNAGVVTVIRYIETEVARNKAHSRRIAAQFDTLSARQSATESGYRFLEIRTQQCKK